MKVSLNKKYIKKHFKDYIEIMVEMSGISALVTTVWQGIELCFFGEIRPSMIDTIIAIPIILILYFCYIKYIKKRYN